MPYKEYFEKEVSVPEAASFVTQGRMYLMGLTYASGPDQGIYHLVVRNELETLCGLRVSRIRSQHSLHLVNEVSSGVMCKHCERINRNRQSEQPMWS
jgi:hypothetical protein